MTDELEVTRGCAIPLSELEWRFTPSGGPGGQHANRSHTRAEVRFDVVASARLSAAQRARIVERLGPVVRVVADDERSQARNRRLALDRLAERLAGALRREAPRIDTRPTAGAKRRRLEHKARRSQIKSNRRRPRIDD